ncbi:MAG: hypothetical protein N3A71_01955 [Candidatus Dojkabacteria bacterium]|nr:hypothetical protein [Candidatus Dojkabacteria bacterium]
MVNYILNCSSNATEEEHKLTVYILSVLASQGTDSFLIYMNELLFGFDFIETDRISKRFLPVGLNKKQILSAIYQINKRGILSIELQDTSAYAFYVYINNNQEYEVVRR